MILIPRVVIPIHVFDKEYMVYERALSFLCNNPWRTGVYQFYYIAISLYLTLPNIGTPTSDFESLFRDAVNYNYDLYLDKTRQREDERIGLLIDLLCESFTHDLKRLFTEYFPSDNVMFRNLVWTKDNKFLIDIETY